MVDRFSLTQIQAAIRNELRILAEEFEAGWATRDTNDGSTYCSQCGAPQPKRGKAWAHDPACEVTIIRERIKRFEPAAQAPGKEK